MAIDGNGDIAHTAMSGETTVVNDNVAPPAPAAGNGAAPADKAKGQPVG